MNEQIKITVVVPAYNVEEWISRCIESLLRQTYSNLEIIIINDGSTDKTGEILEQYAAIDKRIVAVHQPNTGLVEVREYGIENASGQYIGFVDADDEVESDMYERLLGNSLKYDAEISQCGILYCFYNGRKKPMHGTGNVYVFSRNEGYRELMQGTIMEPSLCNKLYKKELLLNSCLDKSILNNEDLLRNSVLFNRAKKSVFEDFCGYHYWRREGSMSNNKRTVQNGTHIINARKLISENAEPEVWKYAFSSYLSALINTYNSLIGNNEAGAIELRKECKDNLNKYKTQFNVLSKGMTYKAYAIMYCPIFYKIVYKTYRRILYKRI